MPRLLAFLALIGSLALSRAAAQTPARDPRVGLRAGWMNAAQAAWNLRLVSTTPQAAEFTPAEPGDFNYMNSDLAFQGHYVIQGSFLGFQVWDVSNPAHPVQAHLEICPAMQSDVSVYRNLLFVSGESPNGRVDCGAQGIQDSVSADRFRGIRIYDISDLAHPKIVTAVQTCRGSDTHTVVTDAHDTGAVFIYVSGQAPVRSPRELAGCSSASPDEDTSSARFRLDVIRVPLANPAQAAIVARPRIFEGLSEIIAHGPSPVDSAEAVRVVDSARSAGASPA